MYTQFYFLHLDKTTAKTVGVRMFDPLYRVLEDNGVRALDLNRDHSSHNYWRDFDESTFILSAVRNPVSRTISEFCWWANYGDNGVRTHSNGRDSQCPFYTKDNLISWLNTKHIKNYQSSVIKDNTSKINMLITAESIKNNENIIRELILKEFNIKHYFPYYPPDFENSFMPHEATINDILNEDQSIVELIKKYNKNDLDLYSQASFTF